MSERRKQGSGEFPMHPIEDEEPRTSKKLDLLPCPFCGSPDVGPLASFIKCYSCDAEGPPDVRRTAEEAWNQRYASIGMNQENATHGIGAHEPETARHTTEGLGPTKGVLPAKVRPSLDPDELPLMKRIKADIIANTHEDPEDGWIVDDEQHGATLDLLYEAMQALQRPSPPPGVDRIADAQCDEIIAALETYEFTGFSHDDIRLIAGTIETYSTATKLHE